MRRYNFSTHTHTLVAVSLLYLLFTLQTLLLAYNIEDSLTPTLEKITVLPITNHTDFNAHTKQQQQKRHAGRQRNYGALHEMSIDVVADQVQQEVNATAIVSALISNGIVNFDPESGYVYEDRQGHVVKRENIEYDLSGLRVYNVGVLMASHLGRCSGKCSNYSHTCAYIHAHHMKQIRISFLCTFITFPDSPFDLERCGPAVDLALDVINEEFLKPHKIKLRKVQAR